MEYHEINETGQHKQFKRLFYILAASGCDVPHPERAKTMSLSQLETIYNNTIDRIKENYNHYRETLNARFADLFVTSILNGEPIKTNKKLFSLIYNQ